MARPAKESLMIGLAVVVLLPLFLLNSRAFQEPEVRVLTRLAEGLRVVGGERIAVRPAFVDCPESLFNRFKPFLESFREGLFYFDKTLLQTAPALLDALYTPAGDSALLDRLITPSAGSHLLLGRCTGGDLQLTLFSNKKPYLTARTLFTWLETPDDAGVVQLASRPSGAQLRLDGKPVGETPFFLNDLKAGSYWIRASKLGFFEEIFSISIGDGVMKSVRLQLKPGLGDLMVDSTPEGAKVTLNGRLEPGITPLVIPRVKSGLHTLKLEQPSLKPLEIPVELPAGKSIRVSGIFPDAPANPHPATWQEPITGMSFTRVAGGCYVMGCGDWTNYCDPDEHPHPVCVDDFYMGRYEVTQGEWQRLMGENPATGQLGERRPVNQISWFKAQRFIDRLNGASSGGFRLPTEAEWEYACRSGGEAEKFPGGTLAEEQGQGAEYPHRFGWLGRDYRDGPFPVGEKQANGLGLYDMGGNVWEWVWDAFVINSYHFHGGRNPLIASDQTLWRGVRGGSYTNYKRLSRCSHRYRFQAGFDNEDVGLRLVRELDPAGMQAKFSEEGFRMAATPEEASANRSGEPVVQEAFTPDVPDDYCSWASFTCP
ncbi:MAG: SUMF1/EgtB/PvdO family nonheme iron enzyme [Magnetococcales bacterium]|nr:SUMF1/EgtB/PvdO family nonheme iron enzyme [Magnetococcales bacterium]